MVRTNFGGLVEFLFQFKSVCWCVLEFFFLYWYNIMEEPRNLVIRKEANHAVYIVRLYRLASVGILGREREPGR